MNLAARAILTLLFVTSAFDLSAAPSGIVSLEADLDGDGRLERIRLDKESDPSLTVLHGKRVVWRGVPARWKPWKLMVADVDGDGRREIVVGVYKPTRFFPKAHNCLFIYGWDGQAAHPFWLGSTLSRPFLDFAFVEGKPLNRLLAIETKRDGRVCLAAYTWNGFGFTQDWQRGDWADARLVETARDHVVIEADGARLFVTSD